MILKDGKVSMLPLRDDSSQTGNSSFGVRWYKSSALYDKALFLWNMPDTSHPTFRRLAVILSRYLILGLVFCTSSKSFCQADNEIQVYASPTIQYKWTIFELHSNYTAKGSKFLADPESANWTNETLEITHGFGRNFEIGFYTFTAISPDGRFQYLGNQLRPRVTVPQDWKWPFGASLSI